MNFLFNTFNHNELGKRSLEDVIGIMGKQMRALGHGAVWQEKNHQWLAAGHGINIVVEGFNEPTIGPIADAHAQGARFLILATEEPTEKGFNHGTQREMRDRQRDFPLAAKYCEGILHLVPGKHVTDWYSQFAPSAPAELGYAPDLVRRWTSPEPVYDFGFYGSVSPRRLKIMKRLSRYIGSQKAVRIVPDFAPQLERDKIMREARVIIQIRKFEEMGLVSSSRCATALSLGRPIVAEPHSNAQEWDGIVKFSKTLEGFYADALMVRTAWKGIHASQFEKFKTTMTPERCIGRALDTIGILRRQAA